MTLLLLVGMRAPSHADPDRPEPVRDGSWVKAIVDTARSELEKELGVTFAGKVGVYLCGSAGEMAKVTGWRHPGWVLAIAGPKQKIIAIDGSKLAIATGNDITVAIRHEMTHIILGNQKRRPPRWFDEGVAEVLSGRPLSSPRPELQIAAKSGKLIALEEIAHDWPEKSGRATLAYAQGVSAVLYLRGAYGEDAVREVVGGLSRGIPFEKAFEETTGIGPAAFEEEWKESLTVTGWGLPVLTLLLRPPYIYTAMSVLTILVAIVVLIRRRFALKRMEEEEPWS